MHKLGWQTKALLICFMDMLLVSAAYFLSLWVRFDLQFSRIDRVYLTGYEHLIPVYVVLVVVVFWYFRLYHSIWEFASVSEMYRLVKAWICIQFLMLVIYALTNITMPRSFLILGTFLSFVFTTGLRFSYRVVRVILIARSNEQPGAERVMVVGAGAAGKVIIHEYMTSDKLQTRACCVIDDNPGKKGRYIDGVPIIGGRDSILQAVDEYNVSKIVVALPGASAQQRKDIINICSETDCKVIMEP